MILKRWVAGIALGSLFSAIACAGTVEDAELLLKQGKPAQAMALLDSDLSANAGNAHYNYLLGIASLDAGKPGNAVFAFERALALDPQQPRAQIGGPQRVGLEHDSGELIDRGRRQRRRRRRRHGVLIDGGVGGVPPPTGPIGAACAL